VKLPSWSFTHVDPFAFSILERIDVGETGTAIWPVDGDTNFQYPRTDRRG